VLPFKNCTVPLGPYPLLCVLMLAVSVTDVPSADAGTLSVVVVGARVIVIPVVEELEL
jgi:hypothetical protein